MGTAKRPAYDASGDAARKIVSLDASIPGLDAAFAADGSLTYASVCLAQCLLFNYYPASCDVVQDPTQCGCQDNPAYSDQCLGAYANYVKCLGLEMEAADGCHLQEAGVVNECDVYETVLSDCMVAYPLPP
jgi:hypothetical protein